MTLSAFISSNSLYPSTALLKGMIVSTMKLQRRVNMAAELIKKARRADDLPQIILPLFKECEGLGEDTCSTQHSQ